MPTVPTRDRLRILRKRPKRPWHEGKALDIWNLVVTSILTLVIGVWGINLSSQLAQASSAQANRTQCTNSVLALRNSLVALKRGYSVDRTKMVSRMADWDDAKFKMEQVTFTCDWIKGDHKSLWGGFQDRLKQLQEEIDVDAKGYWDPTNTVAMLTWTGDALKVLSSS